MATQREIDRFFEQTEPEPNSGCLLWIAAVNQTGYGRPTYDGRQQLAHRVAWQIANGPIPAGMCVCHRCDIPACVNIDHLFLGTKRDNTHDMMVKGRHVTNGMERRTHCKNGHQFNGEKRRRDGARYCQQCHTEKLRRLRARRRQTVEAVA
jgi:hypothetical protein